VVYRRAGNLVTNTSSGSATLKLCRRFQHVRRCSSKTVTPAGQVGAEPSTVVRLTLSGTNTYSGGTTVSGGTLGGERLLSWGDVMVNRLAVPAGGAMGSVAGMADAISYGAFLSPGSDASHTGTLTLRWIDTVQRLANQHQIGGHHARQPVRSSAGHRVRLAGRHAECFADQWFCAASRRNVDILTGSTPSGMFDTLQLPNLTGGTELGYVTA